MVYSHIASCCLPGMGSQLPAHAAGIPTRPAWPPKPTACIVTRLVSITTYISDWDLGADKRVSVGYMACSIPGQGKESLAVPALVVPWYVL